MLELLFGFSVYFQILIVGTLITIAAIGIIGKLWNEPVTSIKVFLAVLIPFVIGVGFPYLINTTAHKLPFFISLLLGFISWGATNAMLEKYVDTRFEDEK